ncbi:AAA ATPase domain-containing protein [Thermomonospora echinospora]|uniref:AAA ATPase domain-containing protein n=1 Tax=Thermomonospora echinospora TaxID=1992 RepID=A0A1H5YPR0_9ACTN|nr:AAA family ATPase [Thermomonospora echinospora]SEG26089.1 AAA ATPase domain-containing protein [Thermomonospora echinospora]
MRLTQAKVINFRALQQATVRFDESATLIVGRNNSGKTSLVSIFEKFFGEDDARFVLEDFSVPRIADMKQAISLYGEAQKKAAGDDPDAAERLTGQALALLPAIRLLLTISYADTDDLAPISALILDLDETCYEAKLEASLRVTRPLDFLQDGWEASTRRDGLDVDRYLRRSFGAYFAVGFHAIRVDAESPQRAEISKTTAQRILSVKFIYAQKKFDDTSADRTRNLSKTFEAYYKANSDDGHHRNVAELERALTSASQEVNRNLAEMFTDIIDQLPTFGVGTMPPVQKLRLVSEIEGAGVLRGSTRIQYVSGESEHPLPEGHNGLGYSKLIFTIVQILDFYQSYRRCTPRPALQLLFIEEPEAHLHPQMQEVFIRNIRGFIECRQGWRVQAIVTTHSSHIVASSGFESVRYFTGSDAGVVVKDLSAFQHVVGRNVQGAETLRFLRQYMTLHRCDMFFADKVIIVEGETERLLLPQMILKCAGRLQHQYVSVIVAGDAYARRFKELLTFIGVPTLIITDIDSVDPAHRRKACLPDSVGAVTSNATLKDWLPGEEQISALLDAEDAAKVSGRVRVAYQVPENAGKRCGRSFEEAFIIANAATLAKKIDQLALKAKFTDEVGASLTAEEIADRAAEIAQKLTGEKTDFAFDIMLLDDWVVPLYIREGLEWLS